ncbi:MAG: hypothetical protein EOO01_14430, partial [Chitinophagaceae bacterium]
MKISSYLVQNMMRQFTLLFSAAFFLFVTGFFTFCTDKKEEKVAETKTPVKYAAHQPGVQFTGTKSCISCHKDYYETFRHTGHGMSFYEPDPENQIEDFTEAVVFDKPSGYYYRAFWAGPDMFISEFRLSGSDTT